MDDLAAVDIDGGLLLGHDGSQFADAALTWALGLADRLDAPVTVVRAWTITTAPRPSTWEFGYVPPLAEFAMAVREKLESDVAPLLEGFAQVRATCQAVHGRAAAQLVEASLQADMLVVGPRGLGGFAGLVMGSTTEQLVRHAKCPVVVVRGQGVLASTPVAQQRLDAAIEPDAGHE
ncbi:MAG: universal stress protein [Nocardioidaceae bacterium]|nr:universal stress protein [Nocardioidaceae bacterium]